MEKLNGSWNQVLQKIWWL